MAVLEMLRAEANKHVPWGKREGEGAEDRKVAAGEEVTAEGGEGDRNGNRSTEASHASLLCASQFTPMTSCCLF